MGNYNNTVGLFVQRADRGKPFEAIKNLFSIDGDFEPFAELLAKKLCKKYKKLETLVEKTVEYYLDDEEIQKLIKKGANVDDEHTAGAFFLINDSYCRDFKVEIHDIDERFATIVIAYID